MQLHPVLLMKQGWGSSYKLMNKEANLVGKSYEFIIGYTECYFGDLRAWPFMHFD